jgi:hypothetical protein
VLAILIVKLDMATFRREGEHKIKGRGKVDTVILLTEHHAMKAYRGSGGMAPHTLDLGTRRR